MRRMALAMLTALVLVGATASGALACGPRHLAPMHVSTSGHEFIVLDPGTTTMNGNVQSVRGLVASEPATWNNVYVDGDEVNTMNWDVDVTTGVGVLWGTGVHSPTAFPGSHWMCAFRADMTAAGFQGTGSCYGTGALRGWRWQVALSSSDQGTAADGWIFPPGTLHHH